ncbi:MAG: hypothetical protein ABSA54_22700 [Terriglobales bacterium]|jgi:hypothetical protein
MKNFNSTSQSDILFLSYPVTQKTRGSGSTWPSEQAPATSRVQRDVVPNTMRTADPNRGFR